MTWRGAKEKDAKMASIRQDLQDTKLEELEADVRRAQEEARAKAIEFYDVLIHEHFGSFIYDMYNIYGIYVMEYV